MNIIICEENIEYLKKLKSLVENCIKTNRIVATLIVYDNFKKFLEEKKLKENDIFIIGLKLKSILDEEFIEITKNIKIQFFLIVLANSNCINLLSYMKLDSFRYISKDSLSLKSLNDMIPLFYYNNIKNKKIKIETYENEIIDIFTKDILYLNIENRKVVLTTLNNKYKLKYRHLKYALPLFNEINFVDIYKGLLVNIKSVKKSVKKNERLMLTLSNNEIIYSSRAKANLIEHQLKSFI